jgi:hypothetical protein
MICPPPKLFAILSTGPAFVAFSCIVAMAQMYPQEMHSSRGRGGAGDPLTQQALRGMGFDDTSEFLKRKDDEAREQREIWQRQRRMMDNFTNVPDQLRDSYFRRADGPSNYNRR